MGIHYIRSDNALESLDSIIESNLDKKILFFGSTRMLDFTKIYNTNVSHLRHTIPSNDSFAATLAHHKYSWFLKAACEHNIIVYDYTKSNISLELLGELEHFTILKAYTEIEVYILVQLDYDAPGVLPNSLIELDYSSLDIVVSSDYSYFDTFSKLFTKEAKEFGITKPKASLAVGFPGTGKTLSALYCAKQLNRPIYQLDISNIFNRLVGDSEKALTKAFRYLDDKECVLFIDEIDKLFLADPLNSTQNKIVSLVLTWLNSPHENCYVFMAANRASNIPIEMLRKGRVDKVIHARLPDKGTIISLLNKYGKYYPYSPEQLEGYTHAEIVWICNAYKEQMFLTGQPKEIQYVPMSKQLPEQLDSIDRWAKLYAN